MSQQASIDWWNKALDEVGAKGMDKLVSQDASWETVLQSGRDDLNRALSLTGMSVGPQRSVLEIGCGMGRMSAALADQFGRVVGVDIAPRLIDEARRNNTRSNVTFEVADGRRLQPTTPGPFDTIFSYEVLYYLNRESLTTYFQDAFALLAKGGEFVFHLNVEPIRLTTHAGFLFRKMLYACGIKQWRGWPTGAGLRRYYHSPTWLTSTLTRIGFRVDRIVGPSARQTWIVAVKV